MTDARLLTFPFPLPGAMGVPTSVGHPAPERRIAGNPEQRSWDLEIGFDRTQFAGLWESDAGCWRVEMGPDWELCHLLDGELVITEDGGATRTLGPGETFVMQPGFSGTWQATRAIRKIYVIRKG